MKNKKTIIISSLIMCLTLIVAVVSVTAAWFGNVTSGRIDADLTIDSDTVDESANVEIDSSTTGLGNTVYPAKTKLGRVESTYPGNYGVIDGQYDADAAQKLYPTSGTIVDDKISDNAKVATIYLTIDYIGSIDKDAKDGKKTLLMSLDGVYIASALKGDTPNYDDPTLVNYKEEFNVKMCLVKNEGSAEAPEFVEDEALKNDVHNDYNEKNPYGHLMYFRVAPGHYTVKFEIYFNKVDEECNFDLLNTTLSLHIKLTKDTVPWTNWDNIGGSEEG